MASSSAVSIDDDLASGKTAVTLGPANNKSAGRIYVDDHVLIHEPLRKRRHDNFFDDLLTQLTMFHVLGMLC